jgi:lactoylglutathione lyase
MSTFPILYVSDVDRAARFYEVAFGFERTYEWKEDDGRVVYAAHKRGDSRLAFAEGEGRGGFELCIYVDDVDATGARLLELGAREVKPAEDMPWGERMAYFDDLDGHRLHVTSSA